VSAAQHTPGHKLLATTIRRDGRLGTAWTCECGNWHPKAADTPFGNRAPVPTVIAYIQRVHSDHAKATVQEARPA
jgi:hypothetical protein